MINEANALVSSHDNAKAVHLDANDAVGLGSLIEQADVVVRLVVLFHRLPFENF